MIALSRTLLMVLSTVFLIPLKANAEEVGWGHCNGRFIYDGIPPKVDPILVTKDNDVFGATVPDESLLINSPNNGIANVVIYLKLQEGSKINIHPSYRKSAFSKVALEMHGGQFKPHILLLQTSQVLEQVSKDKVAYHPVFVCVKKSGLETSPPPSDLNLSYRRGFHEQPVPCTVYCANYPWLKSYLLMQAHPYMAKTDKEGCFSFKNLPVGKHTFCIWHERAGLLEGVQIGDQKTSSKGRLSVVVNKGNNSLGDVLLKSSTFDTKRVRLKGRRANKID